MEMEPARELLMPLLPYQRQFLGWAVAAEQGPVKGGILADEMGMGKTIQVHRCDTLDVPYALRSPSGLWSLCAVWLVWS